MSLVNYSSSDEEIGDNSISHQLPPQKVLLPNPLKSLQTTSTNDKQSILDDHNGEISNHNGRSRSFAHERGIWASYVYISCPINAAIITLREMLTSIIQTNYANIEIHPIEELHLSLSRTIILRHHWIDEFTQTLKETVAGLKRFSLLLNTIKVFCNDEQTRTFICLASHDDDSNAALILNCIVKKVDQCLDAFKLPSFYENASYHVSILWCLGNRKSEIEKIVEALQSTLDKQLTEEDDDFRLNVDRLLCKCGNKYFSYRIV